MNREPMNVIIIGAGTGGLCLAHGLKQAGIDVAIYERDRSRTDGLQGYRVGINAHGVASLAACLPPDLFATFVATCARTPGHFNILTERLTELLSITLDEESMGGKSVSRMTLRQVLLTGLEQHIHYQRDRPGRRGAPDDAGPRRRRQHRAARCRVAGHASGRGSTRRDVGARRGRWL